MSGWQMQHNLGLFAEILKVRGSIIELLPLVNSTEGLMFTLKPFYVKGSHWTDGDEFRPERFLDEEGKVIRDEHLIPFSIGEKIFSNKYDLRVYDSTSLFVDKTLQVRDSAWGRILPGQSSSSSSQRS